MTIGTYRRLSKKNRSIIENIYATNPVKPNLAHIETSSDKENYESNPSINSSGVCSLTAIQENQEEEAEILTTKL